MADESARVKTGAALGSAAFFALAPGVVAGVVPWALTGWHVGSAPDIVRVAGAALTIAGAAVVVAEFVRFVREGRGTPAPLAPTERLVVGGLYRYVRNPMYLGVATTIVGQALLLARPILALYAAMSRWSPRSCASTRSRRCSISSAPSARPTGARCPRGGRGCGRGPGPRSGASLVPIRARLAP